MSSKASTSSPEILAVIPARGGSKGIPRKNLVNVLGKPLIAYSIQQSLASRLITRTIVSTEDIEIAQVAKQLGAEVPFMRPAELASDESLDWEVFDHALRWLREHEGYTCELAVHLRATAPVRRVRVIDEAIDNILRRPEATALRSVNVAHASPYKMWRIEDGYLTPLLELEGIPEAHSMPRQKLPEVYFHNAYIDVIRPAVILEQRSMCGDRVIPFVIHEEVIDIDYPESLPHVKQALRLLEEQETNEPR